MEAVFILWSAQQLEQDCQQRDRGDRQADTEPRQAAFDGGRPLPLRGARWCALPRQPRTVRCHSRSRQRSTDAGSNRVAHFGQRVNVLRLLVSASRRIWASVSVGGSGACGGGSPGASDGVAGATVAAGACSSARMATSISCRASRKAAPLLKRSSGILRAHDGTGRRSLAAARSSVSTDRGGAA